MQTYYLNELIFFFSEQESLDFHAIRKILRVIDEPSISDADKARMIFDILRKAGLYEVEYDGAKFNKDETPIDTSPPNEKAGIIPVQIFELHLLNGVLEQPVNMN